MPQRFNRTDRIAQLLMREIAMLLSRGELRDPRMTFRTSLTAVTVTRDLAHAKVFVIVSGEPDEIKTRIGLLNHAAKEVRMLLSSRVIMRTVPQLKFYYDTSVDNGERITNLLRDTSMDEANTDANSATPNPQEDSST